MSERVAMAAGVAATGGGDRALGATAATVVAAAEGPAEVGAEGRAVGLRTSSVGVRASAKGGCHAEWARVMMEARSNLKPSTWYSAHERNHSVEDL